MIPLKLSIQGLFSYETKQEIDFTTLNTSKLFGIFGKVGSGKSSILEAITLALYKNVNRMSLIGAKQNLVNLNSDTLEIDFTFAAGNKNEQIYRFQLKTKRKKKKTDEFDTFEHNKYLCNEAGEWLPIDTDTETILGEGMNFDNFCKTIIIPQNQFMGFLNETPANRTEMLMKIFGLEKYDFSEQTKALLRKTEENRNKLEGILSTYQTFTPESLADLQQSFSDKNAHFSQLKNDLEKEKQFLSLQEKYWKAHKQLHNLQHQNQTFADLQTDIALFEKLQTQYSTFVQVRDNENELLATKKQYTQLQTQISTHQENLQKTSSAQESINKEFGDLAQIQNALQEIENLLQIQEIRQSLQQNLQVRNQLKQNFDTQNTKLVQTETQLNQLQQQLTTLETQQTDLAMLEKARYWWEKNAQLQNIETKIKQLDSGETFEQQKQQLIANFHLEKLFSATDIHQIRITALRAHLEEEISNTKTKLAATQQNLQHLEVQQQLQQYSQQLSEGEPCPLCGATHHPNPLQNETLPTHLATTNAAKTAEEKRLELLENALKQVENIINEYKNTRTNFKQQQQELSTDLAQKAAAINEKSLLETAEKFQALDQQSKVALAEKQRIQEQISTLQKHFQQQKQNVEISRQQYSEAELAYQTLQKQEIFYTEKIIALATYRSATQNEILALQKTYQSAENELKKLSEKLQQLQQQSFVHQAEEKSLSANIQTLESKINTHKQSLEAAYQQLKITADQAENIFDKAQYLSEKSKVYQQLQYDIAKAKEAFATIETELNGNIISEEALQKQEAELTEKQHTFEALQKEIAVLENNIVLQTQKLREKETISAEYKTIEAKANRLTELRKYFAGKGMVNFVLSKYLQQLTYLANQRFLQLSNNALGLTLNAENNEFAICDYLNGGKSRSVQSLSGGQQFQVSLCLALALSDTVHQRKGNASNFFFLDEGFGSQDNESLQVIFKTLRNLRNENKIIGLISHVDALKEQMDTYVEIQRTEQGSQIFVNT